MKTEVLVKCCYTGLYSPMSLSTVKVIVRTITCTPEVQTKRTRLAFFFYIYNQLEIFNEY